MGVYGSTIIYPAPSHRSLLVRLLRRPTPAPPPPPIRSELEPIARQILAVLESRQLVKSGTAEAVTVDRETTFATCQVLEEEPAPDLAWVHLAVEPSQLLRPLQALVHCATDAEWSGEAPGNQRLDDVFAVPYLDVTVLSAPITLMN